MLWKTAGLVSSVVRRVLWGMDQPAILPDRPPERYVTFQQFRQTFCTDIVASSGNVAYASKQAGHASIKVTDDYYSHWAPEENRHITDGLDDRVRKRLSHVRGCGTPRPQSHSTAPGATYTPPETKSGSPRRTGTPRFDWWAVTDSNRGPAD